MNTPGELFWSNVSKMLEENDKSLTAMAKGMAGGASDTKIKYLCNKLHRYRTEYINPSNVDAIGILKYLKRFDKYLMFSDLYAEE